MPPIDCTRCRRCVCVLMAAGTEHDISRFHGAHHRVPSAVSSLGLAALTVVSPSVCPTAHSLDVNSRVLGIVNSRKIMENVVRPASFHTSDNVMRLDLSLNPIDRRPDSLPACDTTSAFTPLSASHTHTPRRESGRCWASTLLCVGVSTNSAKCSSHPRPSPGRAPRTRSTLDITISSGAVVPVSPDRRHRIGLRKERLRSAQASSTMLSICSPLHAQSVRAVQRDDYARSHCLPPLAFSHSTHNDAVFPGSLADTVHRAMRVSLRAFNGVSPRSAVPALSCCSLLKVCRHKVHPQEQSVCPHQQLPPLVEYMQTGLSSSHQHAAAAAAAATATHRRYNAGVEGEHGRPLVPRPPFPHPLTLRAGGYPCL